MRTKIIRPKLTLRGVEFYLNLNANVQTADIYYYIMSKFGYSKHDLCLAAHGELQQFKFIKVYTEKNGNRH